MRYPWILHAFLFSCALPVLAAGWRQREIDRPMRVIAGWYALLVVENVVGIAWSHFSATGNNLILPQLFLPFEALLLLAALADWQLQPVARTTVRIFIPLYWVLWTLAMIFIEQPEFFSILAGPTLAFLVLAAALFAFISRMQHDDRPVLETSWGWILPGLAIFFAINVTSAILLAILQERQSWELMKRVVLLRAWIYLLANLLITWGIIWPTRHRSSGASSSLLPSP